MNMREFGRDYLGKTLKLRPCHYKHPGASAMFTLFAQIMLFLRRPAPQGAPSVSRLLLENACARAGHNPRQARELRRNARAWLSVIR